MENTEWGCSAVVKCKPNEQIPGLYETHLIICSARNADSDGVGTVVPAAMLYDACKGSERRWGIAMGREEQIGTHAVLIGATATFIAHQALVQSRDIIPALLSIIAAQQALVRPVIVCLISTLVTAAVVGDGVLLLIGDREDRVSHDAILDLSRVACITGARFAEGIGVSVTTDGLTTIDAVVGLLLIDFVWSSGFWTMLAVVSSITFDIMMIFRCDSMSG